MVRKKVEETKKAAVKKMPEKKKMVQKPRRAVSRSSIRIKCNVGYGNNLFIRGQGPGLSWMQGVPLTNIAADEWVWETGEPFDACEFKVLVNDTKYESGENHRLPPGATVQYTPDF
ncbi:MAG: hypothetical protein V4494_03300 [Chlamydiota bacterium]